MKEEGTRLLFVPRNLNLGKPREIKVPSALAPNTLQTSDLY